MVHLRRGVSASQTTARNTVPRSGQPRCGIGVNRGVDDRDRDRDDNDDNGDNNTNTGNQNHTTLLHKKADEIHRFSM